MSHVFMRAPRTIGGGECVSPSKGAAEAARHAWHAAGAGVRSAAPHCKLPRNAGAFI